MKKKLLLMLICVLLAFCCACDGTLPTASPTEAPSASTGPTASPSVVPSPSESPTIAPSPTVTPFVPPAKPSPEIEPEPEIDMDEMYQRVFVNQSVEYTEEEWNALPALDPTKGEAGMITYHNVNGAYQLRYWRMSGISTDLAYGGLSKYKITTTDGSAHARVEDYYYSAYLDVLLENLTFYVVDDEPDRPNYTMMAFYLMDGSERGQEFVVYSDGRVYKEVEGVTYCSNETVDMPYLYTMAYVCEYVDYYGTYGEIVLINEALPEGEYTTVTMRIKGDDEELRVYEDGRVFEQVYTSSRRFETDLLMEHTFRDLFFNIYRVYPSLEAVEAIARDTAHMM